LPDLYEIVDDIDEENILIIDEFYKMSNRGTEEADNAFATYFQDMSSYMDDWVADVLRDEGVPYIGLTAMEMYEKRHQLVKNLNGQNILFAEMLC
jgi:hypothetical protein